MEITVMAFGQLAEILGSPIRLNDINDTDALHQYITDKYPHVISIPFKIAINKKIIINNTAIDANTSIALLPPFSGG